MIDVVQDFQHQLADNAIASCIQLEELSDSVESHDLLSFIDT